MLYFKVEEVCKMLGITTWTLTNWYQWERISLEEGTLTERVLPVPIKVKDAKGKPRMWTAEQVTQLKEFQQNIIRGRHGVMAKVTNPKSRHAKN